MSTVLSCPACGRPAGVRALRLDDDRLEFTPSCGHCGWEGSTVPTLEEALSSEYRVEPGAIRQFETGAKRDTDQNKLDFEGFFSPAVMQCMAEYMHKHRKMADGSLRDSDNWQKGIPLTVYMKSGWRHFFDWWCLHRGQPARETLRDALCGLLFNVMGYLHETLRAEREHGKT